MSGVGVFIAAIVIWDLLFSSKQPSQISTPPEPPQSHAKPDPGTPQQSPPLQSGTPPTTKSSDQNADRLGDLERENARLKRENEQFSAMVDTFGRASQDDATKQPSPLSSTPPEPPQSHTKRDPGTPQQSPLHAETWRGLMVAPEQRCAPYDRRDYYSYSQSLEPRIVKTLGRIYSPYTGQVFTDLKQTHIDHIVAMSEAHDSGLCEAPDLTRRAFAADLLNLTLTSPEINGCRTGGKCAQDAAEWLPRLNQCWFADRVVAVRRKYNLTIDRREADALERVLAACHSTAMIGPEGAAAPD